MSRETPLLTHPVPPDAGAAFGRIVTLQQVSSDDRWNALPGELPIAAAVAAEAVRDGPHVDRVVCVSSAPLHVPHMGAFALSKAVQITPGHVMDLGNHCAAVLDGLWLSTTMWSGQANLLVSATELGRAVSEEMSRTKPGSQQWCDGAAAVVLGGDGPHFIRPLAYVTLVDPSLESMLDVCPTDDGYEYVFQADVAAQFQARDLDNELAVIRQALGAAECPAADIAGIVVVNRGRRRTGMLAPALGIDPEMIISSRAEIGHGGGADFLFNLDRLLSQLGAGSHRIIIVGNGLGYCWSTLLVEVTVAG